MTRQSITYQDLIEKGKKENQSQVKVPYRYDSDIAAADPSEDINSTSPSVGADQSISGQNRTTSKNDIPEGISEADYNYLIAQGVSPEYIKSIYSSKSNNLFEDLYKNSVTAPEAPDPTKVAVGSLLSGLGDSVGLLAQTGGAAMGARVFRNQKESQLATSYGKRVDDLYKQYQSHNTDYQKGLLNARLQDAKLAREDAIRAEQRQKETEQPKTQEQFVVTPEDNNPPKKIPALFRNTTPTLFRNATSAPAVK